MVAVLMRDQYGVDAVRIFADGFQPLCNLLTAQSCIDEQTDTVGFYERRVSAAAASENGDCQCHARNISDETDKTGECYSAPIKPSPRRIHR